jgi:hypothetical protein
MSKPTAVAFVFIFAFLCPVLAGKTSLVWLCLERCSNFNFASDLKMLVNHRSDVTVVSYENWQVSPQGTLQFATHNGKPVSDIGQLLFSKGFSLFPMLTSGTLVFPFFHQNF